MSGFKKSMRAFRRLGLAEELYEDDLKWLEKADSGEFLGEDRTRSFKFLDPFSRLPFSLWINMKPVYDTEEGGYLVAGVIYDLDKGRVSEALPFGGENIKRNSDRNDDDGIVVCRRYVRAFQPSVLERISKAFLADLMEMRDFRERLAGLGMNVSGIAPFMKVLRGDGFDRLLLARTPFKWELHWLADGWPEKNPPPSPFDGDPGSPSRLMKGCFSKPSTGARRAKLLSASSWIPWRASTTRISGPSMKISPTTSSRACRPGLARRSSWRPFPRT